MTWQSFVILSFLFSLFSCQHLSQVQVKLDVYYESLSSDSIKFITTQLYPSWKHFGTDLLNVKFHPYGNSNVDNLDFKTLHHFSVLVHLKWPWMEFLL